MSSNCVKQWLSEFKTLTKSEWNSYAFGIRQDKELFLELENIFQGSLSAEKIDPVCHQLFDFFRSMNTELQRFALELVPALINRYLTAVSKKEKYGGIEACLLGIYNLSVACEDGKPKVSTINIPTLACASIYHEPPSLASLVLTESALHRYHSERPSFITIGPYPVVQCINSQNRLTVLTHVMKCYNANITVLSTSSHLTLCRMCSQLAKVGFDNLSEPSLMLTQVVETKARSTRRGVSFAEEFRVTLNSEFLLELLQSLYYIIFSGESESAIHALEDIHFRASYDLFSDVLMMTNAIRNSLQLGRLDEVKDRIMGISVAVSPSRANPIFSKDAITNASFKARKLPEDIEVPEGFASDGNSVPKERLEGSDLSNLYSERPKITPQKAAKVPIKSIMKKKDDRSKDKNPRRDPDSAVKQLGHLKETFDLQPTRSPRHSTSSTINGDVTGHGMKVIFEQIEAPLAARVVSESNQFNNISGERPVSVCDEEMHNSADDELEVMDFDSHSNSNVVFVTPNGNGIKMEKPDSEI